MKRGKTVRELIEELQKLDQDACIWMADERVSMYRPPEIDVFGEDEVDDLEFIESAAVVGDYYFYAG